MSILVFTIVMVPIAYSLYKGFEAYKQIDSPEDFFVYSKGCVAETLRNSITASNVSLGAAIFAFLGLGYQYRVAAVLAPLTWLPGFALLILLFPRISAAIRGRTLHGYLSVKYESHAIRYIASVASITGFLGAYGIEIVVGIKLLHALLPDGPPDIILAFLLALLVASYTSLGGFKAATHADGVKLLATLIGIFVVVAYSVNVAWHATPEVQTEAARSISADWFGIASLTPLFVISLAMLNLPWQLVDMSVWQRLSACHSASDITRGLRQSIWSIGVLWALLILLGSLLHYFPGFGNAPRDGAERVNGFETTAFRN